MPFLSNIGYIMTNNDVLRRVRYIFDLNDKAMIEIFALGQLEVTREQISQWLKKDDDPDYKNCHDKQMASFLNGFIVKRRGAKEDGSVPVPEKRLNNNMIFMKLKIALNLKAEDIIEVISLTEFRLGKHELSAFFRKSDHKHYRDCKDQVLRNFLNGLMLRHREKLE